MSKYRAQLPQLSGQTFMSDGGQETTLIFQDGIELPEFASFTLLNDSAGRLALLRYYRPYLEIATRNSIGMILESPTWRSNPDWGARLGYAPDALADANRAGVALMEELRTLFETPSTPLVVSGTVGPRGDGYVASHQMSAEEAQAYHRTQIEVFAQTTADMVCALTLNYVEEAIGIARAALACGLPVVISFTVETDGRLPSGMTLQEAIETTDAETDSAPAYYMINCAHPSHFSHVLGSAGVWRERLRGIRANASKKSHAELNEATELDAGDPVELGQAYVAIRQQLPHLNVVGGCCGTDHRHLAEICNAWQRLVK